MSLKLDFTIIKQSLKGKIRERNLMNSYSSVNFSERKKAIVPLASYMPLPMITVFTHTSIIFTIPNHQVSHFIMPAT